MPQNRGWSHAATTRGFKLYHYPAAILSVAAFEILKMVFPACFWAAQDEMWTMSPLLASTTPFPIIVSYPPQATHAPARAGHEGHLRLS